MVRISRQEDEAIVLYANESEVAEKLGQYRIDIRVKAMTTSGKERGQLAILAL